MPNPSPEFSFDLYPGLDAELDAAFERNAVVAGNPDALAPPGLANVVQATLNQQSPEHNLDLEVRQWADEELDAALDRWSRLSNVLVQSRPSTPGHVAERNEHYAEDINRLFKARKDLSDSGELTPEGLNVGETMHIVLIPWRDIRANLDSLDTWLTEMRRQQGIDTPDYINDDLLKAIQEDKPIYRGRVLHEATAKGYLDKQIEHDGDWGMMLMQTSDQAGLDGLVQGDASLRTPDALTRGGDSHFEIADHAVDGLGIFEWLALTMQEDPRQLSTSDYSWMLANRFDVDGDPHVPYGNWRDGRVKSDLRWAGIDDASVRPRLAVR